MWLRRSKDDDNNYAVNLAKVLADESLEVDQLSRGRGAEPDLNPDQADPRVTSEPGYTPWRLAVTFSGGGIRSAAVNLGVIQALAKAGILRQVHYASGISGGGYILGWLTSWVRRSGFDDVDKQLRTGLSPASSGHDKGIGLFSLLSGVLNWLAGASRKLADHGRRSAAASGGQQEAGRLFYRFREPAPARHLREYASYLTPRTGLGSGDTLAMISIYLRNVLLNQTMIVCLLAAIVAFTQLLVPSILWKTQLPKPAQIVVFVIGVVAAAGEGILTGLSLGFLGRNQERPECKKAGLYAAILTVIMAACLWILLPTILASRRPWAVAKLAAVFLTISYALGWACDVWIARWICRSPHLRPVQELRPVEDSKAFSFVGVLVAIVFFAIGVFAFKFWLSRGEGIYVGDWYAILGLPAILVLLTLASYLDTGIAGKALPDAKREWLGRLDGYYLYFATILAIILIGALRGPLWMHLLFRSTASAAGAGKWLKWLLPGGWVFTVVSGLLAAKSPKTSGGTSTEARTLNILAKIAPPVFLAGVFLLVSWGVHTITGLVHAPEYLTWVHDGESPRARVLVLAETQGSEKASVLYQQLLDAVEKKPPTVWQLRGACITQKSCQPAKLQPDVEQAPAAMLHRSSISLVLIAFVGAVISLVLMYRLDANEFSMHLFYRNRLVRTFLGASNPKRAFSPFTGFSLDDDMPLFELSSDRPRKVDCQPKPPEAEPGDEPASSQAIPGSATGQPPCYDGPYPIWGTALNLTSGKELAWQTRKAASFIYSPLYCGWDVAPQDFYPAEQPHEDKDCKSVAGNKRSNSAQCLYAYRGTGPCVQNSKRTAYTARSGPSVGTAMAASGAAISPNWGYHTSPAVAALLALFNIRIGWWTGNPQQRDFWKEYAPGAGYLLGKELLGKTDDASKYVYLSDGGHFENLGIYEMVRRRITYIIACDAATDPDYEFEDLGNAVEKCRRDFGVEIEIDVSRIRPDKSTNLSPRHFAVGIIHYPQLQSARPAHKGILLYLKSSISGREPADVLGQRRGNSRFPHDTLLNQFFTETQFEAYRTLGEAMVTEIWNDFHGTAHANNGSAVQDDIVQGAALAEMVTSFFQYLERDSPVASANRSGTYGTLDV